LHTIRIDLFAIDTLVINVGDRPHFSSFPEQIKYYYYWIWYRGAAT